MIVDSLFYMSSSLILPVVSNWKSIKLEEPNFYCNFIKFMIVIKINLLVIDDVLKEVILLYDFFTFDQEFTVFPVDMFSRVSPIFTYWPKSNLIFKLVTIETTSRGWEEAEVGRSETSGPGTDRQGRLLRLRAVWPQATGPQRPSAQRVSELPQKCKSLVTNH